MLLESVNRAAPVLHARGANSSNTMSCGARHEKMVNTYVRLGDGAFAVLSLDSLNIVDAGLIDLSASRSHRHPRISFCRVAPTHVTYEMCDDFTVGAHTTDSKCMFATFTWIATRRESPLPALPISGFVVYMVCVARHNRYIP